MKKETKKEKQYRRHRRIRSKISGTARQPRLCVFKSNKYIYAQLIDDEKGQTLVAASDQEIKKSKTELPKEAKQRDKSLLYPSLRLGKLKKRMKFSSPSKSLKEKKEEIVRTGKVAIAYQVGKLIAEKAIKNKFGKVVFDKASYRYQGRVKALAEGAREGGLKF